MEHAARVLEFNAVLSALASECETEPAMEFALALVPGFTSDAVKQALDLTTEAHSLLAENALPTLRACKDLRGGFERAAKGGSLNGQELVAISGALSSMRQVRSYLEQRKAEYPLLWVFGEHLLDAKAVESALVEALDGDGEVKDSASIALTEIRQRIKHTLQRIQERIQANLSKYRSLLSDPIYTIRDGRYVIPLKAEYRGRIKGIVHDTSASGQTIFVEPEDVLAAGNQLREAEAAEKEEVRRILTQLSAKVGAVGKEAILGLENAWHLDLALAKARLAYKMKAIRPELRKSPGISIQSGKHPLLLLSGSNVVPLDLQVGFGTSALLITGPNTGGKTVAIKTVGLFVLMAQSGMFVPALQCYLGPFSQVWADIGDEQSIQQSLSTFSGHIKNIARSVKELKPGALSLFDEIGAGTDPAEGAALAKGVLLHLVNNGATVIASTHYGELKAFAYETDGFSNAAMEFDSKTLKPTYRLLMGAPGASHALKIAERYGIPRSIIETSTEMLSNAERDTGLLVEKLEIAQKQARAAQSEADKRLNEARAAEKLAAKKLEEADAIRRNVHASAKETIDAALREIRAEAAAIFEELKAAKTDKQKESIREKLRALEKRGSATSSKFATPVSQPASTDEVKRGDTVRVLGYTQLGTVLSDPKGDSVEVQMGALKMKVATSKVRLVATEPPKPTVVKPSKGRSSAMGLEKAVHASSEIHLRAMRAEEAKDILERFLDDAILAGLDKVRIVHGKGEGILRKLTNDVLKKYREVESFREGEPAEGGAGVTIAYFR